MMDKENIRRLGVIYKGELVGVVTDRNIIRFIPTIVDIMREHKEILANTPVSGSSTVGYCDRSPRHGRGVPLRGLSCRWVTTTPSLSTGCWGL